MRLETQRPNLPAAESADISAWLVTLRKLLRMPEAQAAAILDEMEDHLQQRVRDLQIAGHSHAESVRLALNELGDAATLAHRFQSVTRFQRRRLAMNVAVLGVACGAAVLSAIAIGSGSQDTVLRAYIDQRPQEPQAKITVGTGEIELSKLAERVGESVKLPVHVHWARLDESGLQPDTRVTIVGNDLSIQEIFRRANESLTDAASPLDYRADRGVLEIADREFFDRRERYLATYDVRPIIGAMTGDLREETRGEISAAITDFVSAEDWRDNGGDLAWLSYVDTTLFVEAPPRMHRQIGWILEQLAAGRGSAPAAPGHESRSAADPVSRSVSPSEQP